MDGRQNKQFSIKDIGIIVVLTAILFIQEELLSFIPNVQFTIFLLVLYAKKLGFIKTSIIICIHVLLDNLIMGSLNPFFTPTMLVGWMFIPILITLFCKKIENPVILACFAFLCGLLYSWVFILPNYFVYNINPIIYLEADIIFEIILAACGFITVLLLYKPCSNLFDKFDIK